MTALILASLLFHQGPIDLPANSSVWVYNHAGDPLHDQFLRIWGSGGQATSGSGPSDDWSYGYLQFDLAKLPDAEPKTITLTLYNVAPPSLKTDSLPLQARSLKGKFGDDWDYAKANEVVPGPDTAVFGEAAATDLTAKPVEIKIKLEKGEFKAYWRKAMDAKSLFLALSSKIDPNTSSGGDTGLYKIYSAAAKEYRPTLHIEF